MNYSDEACAAIEGKAPVDQDESTALEAGPKYGDILRTRQIVGSKRGTPKRPRASRSSTYTKRSAGVPVAAHDGARSPGISRLHFTRETAESVGLNRVTGGAIIMAGSGMAAGQAFVQRRSRA